MPRAFRGLLPWLPALLLAACGRVAPPPEVSGELIMATLPGPTTYYAGADGAPAGFEHDLAAAFAAAHGWKLRVETVETLETLYAALKNGEAHIGAAGEAALQQPGRWPPPGVAYAPAYARVAQQVACNAAFKGRRMPRHAAQLKGLRVEVIPGGSQAALLRAAAARAGFEWRPAPSTNAEELLERVAAGLSDCALTDADSLAIAHNYYPGLSEAFVLHPGLEQAWVIRRGADVRFVRQLAQFMRAAEKEGLLKRLRERYFGHLDRLRDADVSEILLRRDSHLRPLMPHFIDAGLETGLDWRLIAAVAYQESQWDAGAVSKTGVRGIMMLTEDTADALGVENRLDPRQSILGGARYLQRLRDELPEDVPEPDRTWQALAAYNIGPAHLLDARRLARRQGRNPDDWRELKAVLPLLARPSHFASLRYGFARGGEARAFAENVRVYYDILKRYERPGPGFALPAPREWQLGSALR